jgi:hypothetical protein
MNGIAGEKRDSQTCAQAPTSTVTACLATTLSFVIGVSNQAILKSNFIASPCVAAPDSLHQVILMRGGPNVSAKLQRGLQHAENDWVVYMHQDVWLPPGWDIQLVQQIQEAERQFGPVGVAGVYGVGDVMVSDDPARPMCAERIGWVVDRGRALKDGPRLPAKVATLDELLLVVRRDSPLCFDSALGNHLYGADLCLQSREMGMATVALGALCHHNSRHVGLGEGFHDSAAVFARKWNHRLPIATPCVIIDHKGSVHILGNVGARPQSIAYALPNRRDFTAKNAKFAKKNQRSSES